MCISSLVFLLLRLHAKQGTVLLMCCLRSQCPVILTGKAAKFLGKLGRRVARTPKHGGGGSMDAAPTPNVIHDAYGGPSGYILQPKSFKSAAWALTRLHA